MAKEKKAKRQLTKKEKNAVVIGIVLLLLLALLIGGLVLVKTNDSVANSLVAAMMPESITGNDNGQDITFYAEKNKDYKKGEDEPIDAFSVYYYDANNERVDLPQGFYKTSTADMQVTVGFLFKAQERLHKVTTVVKVFIALLAVAIVIYLLYIWYLSWSRREDLKKEKMKNQNQAEEA